MRRRTLLVAGAILATGSLIGVGCRHRAQPPAATHAVTSATSPNSTQATTSAAGGTFTKTGIRLDYPAGWITKQDADYELFLNPADPLLKSVITVDIPDLPFHVPGMIPMGLVINGYIDDLKKQAGAPVETRQEAVTIAGAKGKLLNSSWSAKGAAFYDTAIVIVHSDHVYIFRAAGPASEAAGVLKIHDQIAKTISWTK